MDRVPWSIGVLIAFVCVLFVLERLLPLRRQTRLFWRRLMVNLVVTLFALAVASLAVQPLAAWVFRVEQGRFGLLHVADVPSLLRAALGFLLLDLTFYYWHQANHRFAWLWRFHNVHHMDQDMDVSTAFRFHFGEILLSAGFRVLQLAALGVSPGTYLIYEFVFQANTLFHHSNLRLPIGFERLLNLLLVTPRMHGIHHSQVRDETNSNYSVVFPWWDRIHRTIRLNVPSAKITIGVPAYSQPQDNTLKNVLLMPFTRQRNYWTFTEGQTPERSQNDLTDEIGTMVE